MSEKLCLFCVHMSIDTSGMYGDYPDPASIGCAKGRLSKRDDWFRSNGNSQAWFDEDDFRFIIRSAETCDQYKQVKS